MIRYACFIHHAVCCLVHSSTLKIETVHSFRTLMNFYLSTRLHIPEGSIVYSHPILISLRHFCFEGIDLLGGSADCSEVAFRV